MRLKWKGSAFCCCVAWVCAMGVSPGPQLWPFVMERRTANLQGCWVLFPSSLPKCKSQKHHQKQQGSRTTKNLYAAFPLCVISLEKKSTRQSLSNLHSLMSTLCVWNSNACTFSCWVGIDHSEDLPDFWTGYKTSQINFNSESCKVLENIWVRSQCLSYNGMQDFCPAPVLLG